MLIKISFKTIIALSMFCAVLNSAFAAPFDFKVDSASTMPAQEKMFERTSGWTGGDSAYTVRLSKEKLLWLFGDSFFGPISNKRRKHFKMVRNCVALQEIGKYRQSIKFFAGASDSKSLGFFRALGPGEWLWPGDGVMVGTKLFLFMQRIKSAPESQGKANDPLGFEVLGSELLIIDNPNDVPHHWFVQRYPLPSKLIFGTACIVDGDYLYCFAYQTGISKKAHLHPQILTRIPLSLLKDRETLAWQFCTKSAGLEKSGWSLNQSSAVEILQEGSSEMSVSKVPGMNGYFLVHSRADLSNDILIHHADTIDGAWSDGALAYRCPKIGTNIFVYAAKAHPELSVNKKELILTYCRNSFRFQDHIEKPDIYRPQFVRLHLSNAN